ncbi:MAG: putative ribosomal methyltransferase [Acidimicrobiales bacterium]|nr:putative ribosomal methyltransferase [Acidimicrobiales bacterium]
MSGPRAGSLRVVAGAARGRRLAIPAGATTRPTSDRVREAVFNALVSLDVVAGARVIDPFAGSGALGIEALSRGAASAVFVDTDRAARAVVEANLAATDLGDRASVRTGTGEQVLRRDGPWDLVLLDPPYAFDGWDDLLVAAASSLAEEGVIVVESDREVPLPPVLDWLRCKRYGSTVVTFARLTGDAP